MIILNEITNSIQSPWFNILYKKNINPLKDVKHEKKPLIKSFFLKTVNLFAITKPKNKDPINETMKLLFIKILIKVAA